MNEKSDTGTHQDLIDPDAEPPRGFFELLKWAAKTFVMLPLLLGGVAVLVAGDWLYRKLYGEQE